MTQDQLNNDTKECPFCAETIKAQAVLCRFCNRQLVSKVENEIGQKASTEKETTDSASSNFSPAWLVFMIAAGIIFLVTWIGGAIFKEPQPRFEKPKSSLVNKSTNVQSNAESGKVPTVGQIGYVKEDIIAAVDVKTLDDVHKAAHIGDKIGFERFFSDEEAFSLPKGTKIQILEYERVSIFQSELVFKIRVLNGDLYGKAIYMYACFNDHGNNRLNWVN